MSQPPFLLRAQTGRGRPDLVQVDAFAASYPERTRVKRDLGPFVEVEGTGRHDHGHLRLHADHNAGRMLTARGYGRRFASGDSAYVEATAAGVKGALRRLRESEASQLDAVDEEIAAVEARLSALRQTREDIVKEAWKRANVVRLVEVTAVATEGY